jgi:SAM-dependent methyltransferase
VVIKIFPLCDDLIPVGNAEVCKEYPIEILFCENCVTAHQRFQVPKRELFPSTYHYRARFTADVLNGMKSLVEASEAHVTTLKNKKVLDIGCNDGSLLSFFKEKGCETIGIEPTDAHLDAKNNGHVVYNAFFSVEAAETILKNHGKPDVITFTNVFAHIENLPEVINALKLLSSPDTMIVIENHYLGGVLARKQFDTFYHEHPRSYSFTSFMYIAKSLGKDIQGVEFPSRYGGNIRIFIGGKVMPDNAEQKKKVLEEEKSYLNKFADLRADINKWLAKKGEFLNSLKKDNQKWKGKAFPGRAAILIKMLGIDESVISSVYEKPGSMKIGHYIPGTRIPILSDDTLFAGEKNKEILNFAWHISDEIKSYLVDYGYTGKVINVIETEDF